MAQYRDTEFTDGRTVRVHLPPTRRIIAIVEKQNPRPQPPVITEKTATGREISMRIDDDPIYLAALAEWEEFITEEIDRMGSLFMFKDEEVPDGWDVEAEVGAEVRYFDPTWAPREGAVGRKLDYIEWDLLADVENSRRVTSKIAEMSGIDLEEVTANEASFRDQMEESTDQ
jgi:hypothetical protein